MLDLRDCKDDVSTRLYTKGKVSVGTAEEPIPVGEVVNLGWTLIKNLDPTNDVEIRAAAAGTSVVVVPAGKAALFHWASGVSVPVWLASGAACQVEFLLVSR